MASDRVIAHHRKGNGCFFIIGGAEDPDEDRLVVLPHLVDLAGRKKARIVVCGAPSEDPEAKMRAYRPLFERIGVAEVIEAPIADRADAESEALLAGVDRATAVFFTGGDQLRLTSLVAGTSFGERVRERVWHEGLVVAGTSAGAAALGSVMPIAGRDAGTVRRADVTLAPGLGYVPDAVIDTHFSQRGRVSRLLTVFAQNPQVIGIGIDENTAIEMRPAVGFRVVGEGVVTVLDGRVSHSNAAEAGADGPLALTDVRLHVLPAGYAFDLRTKRPALPDRSPIPAL